MKSKSSQKFTLVSPSPETEKTLESLVSQIRQDARQKPAQYIKDTRVPEGGE